MPSERKRITKSGKVYYEIRVRISRDKPELSTRWYVPAGWSETAIQRELRKQAAAFEASCRSGEILTREEKREAKERAAREAAAIQTVKQYGEAVFMPKKAVALKETTRSFYQYQLDKHIYPVIGFRLLPEITTADINALLLKMQKDGYAHASVKAVYTTLQQLFKMAYNTDLIAKNPMDKADKPTAPKTVLKDEAVPSNTADELREIISCLEEQPLKWRALIRLLIDSGIRRGEACGLKWRYVDTRNSSITIAGNLEYSDNYGGSPEAVVYYTDPRKTKAGEEKRGAVYYTTPKSGKARTIDIDPAILKMLKDLRKEQAKAGIISEYVFTQDGSPLPIQPQSPTQYLRKLSKSSGLPDLHPHKLRHSFASIAITNGADIASVSEKLGHANKAITLKLYTHADRESMKRASSIFREALTKKQA